MKEELSSCDQKKKKKRCRDDEEEKNPVASSLPHQNKKCKGRGSGSGSEEVSATIPIIQQPQQQLSRSRLRNIRKALKRREAKAAALNLNQPGAPLPLAVPQPQPNQPIAELSICPQPIAIPIPTQPQQVKNKRKKKKKKSKSALGGGEEAPDQHNDNPLQTPLQTSGAVTPIHPTITVHQITPATNKKTKNKKGKSAPNTQEGTEPEKHNAEEPAAHQTSSVHRTKGLTITKVDFRWPVKSYVSKCNARPFVETRLHTTKGLKVTEGPSKTLLQRTKEPTFNEAPFKRRHAESSMICRACQQPGHKSEGCPRLKCLSKDEEVCFFCGEIGHSLGKCSVSTAGGGRFAKCLFCYAQGHFSNNCPSNGHGIGPKAVAANEPINRSMINVPFNPVIVLRSPGDDPAAIHS